MAAARGDDDGAIAYAVDRALAAALADVMPPAPKKLAQAGGFRGDDTPIAEAGTVLVRLPAKTPWHLVADEQKYLAGAKGVRAATLWLAKPPGWAATAPHVKATAASGGAIAADLAGTNAGEATLFVIITAP